MVKCQTTPEDGAICDAQINDVQCTVGIQRSTVELSLSCNHTYSSIEKAQRSANLCAKGENGQFCGSLWERYRPRSNYISGNCSRVLTANSCPSSCSSLLEEFRSTLGCCINAYVNGTGLYSEATAILIIVYGTCVMSLFLLQPVEMVQPSTLRLMYRIAQIKIFSTSIISKTCVYQSDIKQSLHGVLESSNFVEIVQ